MVKYLEHKEIYVRDVYACSLEKFKLNIRVINEYPWSNHFVSNMFNDLEEKDIKSLFLSGILLTYLVLKLTRN